MTTNQDLHEQVAAYALDALDGDERRAFEAHLAGCERCRADLAGLTETAGTLGLAADAAEPPNGLRDRLLAAAREEGPSNVVAIASHRRRRFAIAGSRGGRGRCGARDRALRGALRRRLAEAARPRSRSRPVRASTSGDRHRLRRCIRRQDVRALGDRGADASAGRSLRGRRQAGGHADPAGSRTARPSRSRSTRGGPGRRRRRRCSSSTTRRSRPSRVDPCRRG